MSVSGFMMVLPLAATLGYLWYSFGSLRAALPRWAARWIIIWPYSWGILKGLCAEVPPRRRERDVHAANPQGPRVRSLIRR